MHIPLCVNTPNYAINYVKTSFLGSIKRSKQMFSMNTKNLELKTIIIMQATIIYMKIFNINLKLKANTCLFIFHQNKH